MSIEAITWALKQPLEHSPAKFVLVVLANQASSETGHAFPSVAYLAATTGQDRKTVITNLQRLVEWGKIEDTGKRVGRTSQIIGYRLLMGSDLFDNTIEMAKPPVDKLGISGDSSKEKRNSSENGTVPVFPENRSISDQTVPEFPIKESQIWDTEPKKRNKEERANKFASEQKITSASSGAHRPAPKTRRLTDEQRRANLASNLPGVLAAAGIRRPT